ncbi:MAG: ABC transporter substrate-binding protein [Pseudolabrys sp.]
MPISPRPSSTSPAGAASKAIAAQARERRRFEGSEVVASNAAYDRGLHSYADLAGKVIAISQLGSPFHHQLGQIARIKGFALDSMTLKPLRSPKAMARAVERGTVDAAILPARYARDLLAANQAKPIGWVSDLDEQQLDALFTTGAMIAKQRATVAHFVHAYRRGVADYAKALLRHGRFGKRVADAEADATAALIALYIYPDGTDGAPAVETSAYFVDPRAHIDISDIARQTAWYKTQGLVGTDVDATARP